MALTSPKMGLRIWDQLSDPYDHNQLADNMSKIDFHDHSPGRGVQIPTEGIADGAITSTKLASTVFGQGSIYTSALNDASRLGLTDGATIRRGVVKIPGSETRTSTSYSYMPTADRVSSLVLPTNGIIAVLYQAVWAESVANASTATITLNNVPVAISSAMGGSDAGPVTQSAGGASGGVTNVFHPLYTTFNGLAWLPHSAAGNYTGDLTTGQIIGNAVSVASGGGGGPCYIYAVAGTYDVGIQFKSTSGSVSRRGANLWVWTTGF